MEQIRTNRKVRVAGVGLHPFGRFRNKDISTMAREAVVESLRDAGIAWNRVQVGYFGHVYYEGMSIGERVLSPLGLTGIPIVNVENACSSGSTALWQAFWMINAGLYDVALVFGAEKVPSGPVTVTGADSPDRLIGGDHMMAGYALRMKRYITETGASEASIAQVAVKNRQHASMNPYAHRNEMYSLEEVLKSRVIADPLTLFQCCPTSEGAAAVVICADDVIDSLEVSRENSPEILASVLTSGDYNGNGSDHSAFSPYRTEPAALKAYEMANISPEDVDLIQVHDAATIGELQQLESLHIFNKGEAWIATEEGRTSLSGDRPTNTDGGLLAMGHPFGASGIRMIHETVLQLRKQAGARQIENAQIGVSQCSGAGDVTTVHILKA